MADTDPKVDATSVPAADAGPKLVKDETAKLASLDSSSESKTEPKTETITEKAGAAATAAKDNVFSMFGGGPKKVKQDEGDEENDRSGSAKAQAAKDDVCILCEDYCFKVSSTDAYIRTKTLKLPSQMSTSSQLYT